MVADFNSSGPYNLSVQILNPDVIAPGVSIVASCAKDASLTETSIYGVDLHHLPRFLLYFSLNSKEERLSKG